MAVNIKYPQSHEFQFKTFLQVGEFGNFHYSSLTANIKVEGQLLSNDETK